jgi:hypothetical protein
MANETTQSSVQYLIPEIISDQVVAESGRVGVFENVVRMFDFTGPGDILNVPQRDSLSFASLSEGLPNSYEDYAPTQRQLQPILIGTSLLLSWEALNHSAIDVQQLIVDSVAAAWAEYTDSEVANLYTEAPSSNPTHEQGQDGTALTFSSAATILQLLLTQNAPRPYAWVIHPTQLGELLGDSDFKVNLTQGRGQFFSTQGGAPDNANYWGNVLGLEIWVSDQIVESTGLHSMAFSKEAFGIARKRISTPKSPSPQFVKVETDWDVNKRGLEVAITVCQDAGGIAFTSITNKWVVDYKS